MLELRRTRLMAAHTDLSTQNNAKGRQRDSQNHGWQARNTILQSVSLEGKALSFGVLMKYPEDIRYTGHIFLIE